DNIVLGAPVFVPGYESVAVAGTSHEVTGLSAYTPYFYVVNATTATSSSANSNTIEVTTSAQVPTLTWGTIAFAAPTCDGSEATFMLTGLQTSSNLTLTFQISEGDQQTVNVTSDSEGNASF